MPPRSGGNLSFVLTVDGHQIHHRTDAAQHLSQRLQRGGASSQVEVVLGGTTIQIEEARAREYNQRRWVCRTEIDPNLHIVVEADRDGSQITRGTITRLENLVESLPAHITNLRVRRSELEHSISQSQRLLGKPFQHAQTLADARRRFEQVTAQIADIERQPAVEPPGAEHIAAVEQVLEVSQPLAATHRPALPPPPELPRRWEPIQADRTIRDGPPPRPTNRASRQASLTP